MFSLRTHAWISAVLFALLIGIPIIANILQLNPAPSGRGLLPVQIAFFGLFFAFGFSLIPVMVKAVFAAQRRLGNAEQPLVKAASSLENLIIWGMWAMLALGLTIAIPAAIMNGLFDEEPAAAVSSQT